MKDSANRKKWRIIPNIHGVRVTANINDGVLSLDSDIKINLSDLPDQWQCSKKNWSGRILILPDPENPVYLTTDKGSVNILCKRILKSIPLDFLVTSHPYTLETNNGPYLPVPLYTEAVGIHSALASINKIRREINGYINENWEVNGILISNGVKECLFILSDKEALTTLSRIEFTIAKTGDLTATAILDPVSINGDIISRAALHLHRGKAFDASYRAGDIVRVVIPNGRKTTPKKIEIEFPSNNNLLTIPDRCPSCNAVLIMEKTLKCSNHNCPEVLIKRLTNFCSSGNMGISGIGKQLATALVNYNAVSTLDSLYDLTEEDLSLAIYSSGISAAKIIGNIEASRHCKLEKLISGLGIDGIGSNMSKLIAWACKDIYGLIMSQYLFTGKAIPILTSKRCYANLCDYLDVDSNQAILLALNYELKTTAPAISCVGHELQGLRIAIDFCFEPFYTKTDIMALVLEAGATPVEGTIDYDYSLVINHTKKSITNKRILSLPQFLLKVLS